MASLQEIRTRIKSIKNTAKITHAMELVAAAKMKRAQNSALGGKPYSSTINQVIENLAAKIDPSSHPLLARQSGNRTLVVFFSTDRGLAGALNSNLYREISQTDQNTKFITFGKKARNFIAKTGRELIADYPLPEKPELSHLRPLSKLLIDSFLKKEFDQVFVIYTRFDNTLKQVATTEQLLPIVSESIIASLAQTEESLNPPIFEPSPDLVLNHILPNYILMELYHILLEAKASEHSARMVSMKNATENAQDLSEDLNLTYNGIRQDNITKELLDITTAALAVE